MMENPTLDRLKTTFASEILKSETFRDKQTVVVKRERILDIMKFLRDDPALVYDMLVDLTAVDYLKMDLRPRFQVVYHLRSFKYNRRVRIKAPVPENDCHIESVCPLWKAANWYEREVYEMYGITFDHHPDLRRLLIPETFTDYPLRKDYPLRGKGERDVILPEGS
jgi:NADH-quinone oxidoreductase subunit C